MPISTGPRDPRDEHAVAMVNPTTGAIVVIADEPHKLTFDPASRSGWPSAAALALAAAGWGMRLLEWIPSDDGWYAMGVRPIDAPAPAARAASGDPLAELRAAFLEWDQGGASSNDIVQGLDDFLTERGYPTVLYRER